MVKIKETSCDYKAFWKFLNIIGSLLLPEWSSESKYFKKSNWTFADITYNIHNTDTATDHITPLCACTRGVTMWGDHMQHSYSSMGCKVTWHWAGVCAICRDSAPTLAVVAGACQSCSSLPVDTISRAEVTQLMIEYSGLAGSHTHDMACHPLSWQGCNAL
jgi:hypothetical protein